MTLPESWRNVGNRIRHLRKTNRLTLKQLSRGCDLSANTISLVERGEVAPSIETLCKIATALGVSPGSLFLEVCTPRVVFQSAVEREYPSDIAGQTLQAMTSALLSADPIQPSVRIYPSGDSPNEPPLFRRLSILCLCGQIDLEVDGQNYCLHPGDNLALDSSAFHRLRNSGSTTGTAVLVLPPNTPIESQTGD